jgi:hypothetical protein
VSSSSIWLEDDVDGRVFREIDEIIAGGASSSSSSSSSSPSPSASPSRGHVYIREIPKSRGRYQFGYTLDIVARRRFDEIVVTPPTQFVFTRFVTDCRAVDARMRIRVAFLEDDVPIDVIIELMRDASAPFGVAGDDEVTTIESSPLYSAVAAAASPIIIAPSTDVARTAAADVAVDAASASANKKRPATSIECAGKCQRTEEEAAPSIDASGACASSSRAAAANAVSASDAEPSVIAVDIDVAAASSSSSSSVAPLSYCDECGARVKKANAKYCSACGEPL